MSNKITLISRLTRACLITEIVKEIAEDAEFQLNELSGSENDCYYATLEYIREERENFTAEIFLAMKKIFHKEELILLQKSNTDSRNFQIAYIKLRNFFKSQLTENDKNSFHMTTTEMYAMLFDFLSSTCGSRFEEELSNKSVNKICEDFMK